MSPKCQGADVILFWLNYTKNYEDKRKGQEWAPPPPAVLLIIKRKDQVFMFDRLSRLG